MSTLLEGKDLSAAEEFDVKWLAASLYSGTRCGCLVQPQNDLTSRIGGADTVCYARLSSHSIV